MEEVVGVYSVVMGHSVEKQVVARILRQQDLVHLPVIFIVTEVHSSLNYIINQ